jgi:hypothetical protein
LNGWTSAANGGASINLIPLNINVRMLITSWISTNPEFVSGINTYSWLYLRLTMRISSNLNSTKSLLDPNVPPVTPIRLGTVSSALECVATSSWLAVYLKRILTSKNTWISLRVSINLQGTRCLHLGRRKTLNRTLLHDKLFESDSDFDKSVENRMIVKLNDLYEVK